MAPIKENGVTSWKHIGLYDHSVGTFTCNGGGILWKSALNSGGGGSSSSADPITSRSVPKAVIDGAQWTVFGRSGYLRVKIADNADNAISSKLPIELRFDGFPSGDFDDVKEAFQTYFQIDVTQLKISSAGTQYGLSKIKNKKLMFRHCVLEDANEEEGEEFEVRQDDEMLSLDLTEVSQCVLPGNNRNEIELQFPESDAVETSNDQLVSVRLYIPPDPDADPSDKTTVTNAEDYQKKIMALAKIRKTTGDVLIEFDLEKGSFLTPRGRYSIELYEHFFRMRGQKYDYKIKYDDISRLFLLPKPDEVHVAFVISLDKPIRQGQQRYQHLVLQTTKEQDRITVNLDEETLQKEYNGELQQEMKGQLSHLIAKSFKIVAKKKVFIPGKFHNASQEPCVKCALRANEGLLYPLEKQLIFIHKPPVLIRFNEIADIEFQRYSGGGGTTRNFDLCVTLKKRPDEVAQTEYTFAGIDKSDYGGLYNFFEGKGIKIINISQGPSGMDDDAAPVYNEDEIYGGPDDGEDEESEDEDYDEKAAAADKEDEEDSDASDDDMDSDDFGSEVDDDLDSDLEEARGGSTKKSKKKKASSDSDSDDDEDDEPKKKKGKRKSDAGGKRKAEKDPNAPKRALSAFMLFSKDKRSKIKERNPDASFGDIAKLVTEAYKNMSDEERAKYDKKAEEEKERYKKEMAKYTPSPGAKGAKGKAKKDPNAPKRGLSAYMFFMQKIRSKIQEENPDAPFGEIGKIAGQKWKELSAEKKAKYNKMAEDDKARYEREMKEYKSKKKNTSKDDSDDDDDDDEEASPPPPKKKTKTSKKKAPSPTPDDDDDDDSDGIDDDDLHLDDDSDDSSDDE